MKILIAIDKSDASSRAMKQVLDTAWAQDTEFRVISVMEPITGQFGFADAAVIQSVMDIEAKLAEERRQDIKEAERTLKNCFPQSKVSGILVEGPVADSIVDEAKKWNADLLVVGTNSRHGFEKLWLGSIAEKVARCAPCSVEVVKDKNAFKNEKPKGAGEASESKSKAIAH